MKIYNTLSKKIEHFKPLKSTVTTLYTCGPTVYDRAHIGNLRTYIFEDTLKRVLILENYKVMQVMNITDVDDKTIIKSQGKKSKHQEITRLYEKYFFEDIDKLNILGPDSGMVTRATEYIEQMAALVLRLLDKGFAYQTDDGSIYFSITKFKNYGILSNLDESGIKNGARVAQDEYEKENSADFALWKAWDEDDGEIFWDPSTWLGADTPLGKGRPGWHIECSAMSQSKLGETIDIHAGGVDLIFPHHENEIAQSEAASGKQFARYWIHGEHLLVDGKKMSKSLHNFYTLEDIIERGFDPLDFRYLCLQAHYRSKLNFTWEGLSAAANARARLKNITREMSNSKCQIPNKSQIQNSKYLRQFNEKIFDDLNTPEALAVVWEMVRDEKLPADEKVAVLQELDDKILALGLFDKSEDAPDEINKLLVKRSQAKAEKDFAKADQIRDQIELAGYLLEDGPDATRIIKK